METCVECGCDVKPGTGGSQWSDGVNYPWTVCSDWCENKLMESMSGFNSDGRRQSDGMTGGTY